MLPYDFDLLFDVKTVKDVERVTSLRTIVGLINLFAEHELPVPTCLNTAAVLRKIECDVAESNRALETLTKLIKGELNV